MGTRSRLRLALVAAVVFAACSSSAHSQVVIDFEHEPNLPTQPGSFALAGPMQSYTHTGEYTISGGVVLGNPGFLAAFTTQGTPPNLYGSSAFGDPSLLSTITLDIPAAEGIGAVAGVLFNGQPFTEDYVVTAFSGATQAGSDTLAGVAQNLSPSGFANFHVTSGSSGPITRITITSPNTGADRWDFFVDTLTLTPVAADAVPEPSPIALGAVGLATLASLLLTRRRARTSG